MPHLSVYDIINAELKRAEAAEKRLQEEAMRNRPNSVSRNDGGDWDDDQPQTDKDDKDKKSPSLSSDTVALANANDSAADNKWAS